MAADSPPQHKHYTPAPVALARGRALDPGRRTLLMAVVNVTPDSFFPGSRTPITESAVERALQLIDEGADIIDIGGESTRPGSDPATEREEIERVLPVVESIAKTTDVAISVDTRKAAVAQAALSAGADIVNDTSALTADPLMLPLVAETGAIAVLMHMRGTPRTMQEEARYEDVVLEVKAELGARIAAAMHAGVKSDRLWIDPGLGFAKEVHHNLELLRRLDEFAVFEKPLLIGASRKSFIGHILDQPNPERRLEGSLAVAALSVSKGAHIIRTHDVAATRSAVRMIDAIFQPAD